MSTRAGYHARGLFRFPVRITDIVGEVTSYEYEFRDLVYEHVEPVGISLMTGYRLVYPSETVQGWVNGRLEPVCPRCGNEQGSMHVFACPVGQS